jgi:hypothetical protein
MSQRRENEIVLVPELGFATGESAHLQRRRVRHGVRRGWVRHVAVVARSVTRVAATLAADVRAAGLA